MLEHLAAQQAIEAGDVGGCDFAEVRLNVAAPGPFAGLGPAVEGGDLKARILEKRRDQSQVGADFQHPLHTVQPLQQMHLETTDG